MAAFAKAFINEGIAVGGDVPQDPKFWQNLKKISEQPRTLH